MHVSDEFKLNVNYEIDWSQQDKLKLKQFGAADGDKSDRDGRDSEIEEESPIINMTEKDDIETARETLLPQAQKEEGKSVKTINLGRNLDQIIYLENLVQRQFSKNKELIRFI